MKKKLIESEILIGIRKASFKEVIRVDKSLSVSLLPPTIYSAYNA